MSRLVPLLGKTQHMGNIPGAKVEITQHSSIKDARASEKRIIKRQQPKYNTQDK